MIKDQQKIMRRGGLKQLSRTNQHCRCSRCLHQSSFKKSFDALPHSDTVGNERGPCARADKNRRSLSSSDTCVDFCLQGPVGCGFDVNDNEMKKADFLDDFTDGKDELTYDLEEKRCCYQTTLWDLIRYTIEDQLSGWSLLEMPKNKCSLEKVELKEWSLLSKPKRKVHESSKLPTVDDFLYA